MLNPFRMYVEENEESFINNLSTLYKNIVHKKEKRRILVSKPSNFSDSSVCKGYVDDTSVMLYKYESDKNICILEIPANFYNCFIGKNGVMKIKNEKLFDIQITIFSSSKIIVEGKGKKEFSKYVLDKIYNYI